MRSAIEVPVDNGEGEGSWPSLGVEPSDLEDKLRVGFVRGQDAMEGLLFFRWGVLLEDDFRFLTLPPPSPNTDLRLLGILASGVYRFYIVRESCRLSQVEG